MELAPKDQSNLGFGWPNSIVVYMDCLVVYMLLLRNPQAQALNTHRSLLEPLKELFN